MVERKNTPRWIVPCDLLTTCHTIEPLWLQRNGQTGPFWSRSSFCRENRCQLTSCLIFVCSLCRELQRFSETAKLLKTGSSPRQFWFISAKITESATAKFLVLLHSRAKVSSARSLLLSKVWQRLCSWTTNTDGKYPDQTEYLSPKLWAIWVQNYELGPYYY